MTSIKWFVWMISSLILGGVNTVLFFPPEGTSPEKVIFLMASACFFAIIFKDETK